MFRLYLIGGVMLFVVVGMGLTEWNHNVNYVPANASITEVSSSCYLKKVDRGVLTKTTTTTDSIDCNEAERLAASHPEYQGMDVKGTIEVEYDYISPVDNKRHHGDLGFSYESNPRLADAKRGDVLPILAHKTNANDTVRDNGRMKAAS